MSESATTKRINIDNENRIISYLFRNPGAAALFTENLFLNPTCSILFQTVQKLAQTDTVIQGHYQFSAETILTLSIDFGEVSIQEIQTIHDVYTDFTNMEIAFDALRKDHLSFEETEFLLKQILISTTRRGSLDLGVVRGHAEELISKIDRIDRRKVTYDVDELMFRYMQEIAERDKGKTTYSLGHRTLNNMVVKPANPGEITTVFAESGMGKSTFVKSIENILANMGVCILSVNLEMNLFANMDRLIAMRENISVNELNRKDIDEAVKRRLWAARDAFLKLQNFRYCDADSMSFSDLDYEIADTQNFFMKKNLLPSTGYMVVPVDLVTMITDFGDLEPTTIERALNVQHRMARKHNVHFINVVQQNENKLRGASNMFKKSSDLDNYRIGLEDIKGGAAHKERSRVVIGLYRPLYLKRRLFPEEREALRLEPDILQVHLLKQNDGDIGFGKMVFQRNFRVANYVEVADSSNLREDGQPMKRIIDGERVRISGGEGGQ